MAPQHYSDVELKAIGKQCGNRLPPASAVQAMFLYEMQRETEVERLFQHQIFQLAKAEEHSQARDARISELSEEVKALRKQLASKDVEERVSTSKVRFDALQSKLNQYNELVGEQNERLSVLERKMHGSESTKDAFEKRAIDPPALQSQMSKTTSNSADLEDVKSELSNLNEDVAVLFEERNALATLLNEANARTDAVKNQTSYSVERAENAIKKMEDVLKRVEKEASEQISKAEQRANDRIERAEQRAADGHEKAKQHADDQSKNFEKEANERIAEVEQKTTLLFQQANQRIACIEQQANERVNKTEKEAEKRVAKVEEQLKQLVAKVEQHATEQAAKAKQDALDQITAGQMMMTNWIRALDKVSKEETLKVEKQVTQQLEKIGDRTFQLKFQFQSEAKEQKERIDKLEDLVRALTAQSPNSISPSSQLLPVQTSNGETINLSVPKGNSFVSQKENIRSFTPGKQWMP